MVKKRKSSGSASSNDTKVAVVVLGLFTLAILFFWILPKHKAAPKPRPVPVEPAEPIEMTKPIKRLKPVRPIYIHRETSPEPVENLSGSGGRIAFIIDDWGQSTANCRYLKDIPEPIAVSILPGLRHTKDVANCTATNHKLAMLHLPLEALHNYDFYPPNYIIKTSMKPSLASKILDDDLAQLPSIEGVNNHMGSKATEDKPLMKLIFKRIKKQGLFFIDSMTAHNTVCAALADEIGISFGKRDVFLDNVNTREAIVKQILVLAQKARHRGYAVAIGHDRHLTMQVIKDEIPWLEKQGFQIVSIKDLLKKS